MRTFEIARALARDHEVHLVDGGRAVPRPDAGFTLVPVPRIYRDTRGLVAVEAARGIDEVLAERRRLLADAITRIRPDALLIEHFPFSKWELREEILATIERARETCPSLKVFSSVRDIVPSTRHDLGMGQKHDEVLSILERHFDALLVHADPRVVRLEHHLPWAGEIRIPVRYTGYVSEKPAGAARSVTESDERPIIASAGGGGGSGLVSCCIEAWKQISAQRAAAGRTLVIFVPLFASPQEIQALKRAASGYRIRIEGFAPSLLPWMQSARLSISHAGYNTCTNLLETHTRAILVPNPEMSDQGLRARRLVELGLAQAIDPEDLSSDRLSGAILAALAGPAPEHDIDLDGAEATRRLVDETVARGAGKSERESG